MAITQTKTGWQVEFRINGRGSRKYKRVFPTKAECDRFQRFTVAQYETQSYAKPWLEKPRDTRKLSDLIELWDDTHGHFLRDGKRRKSKLLMIAEQLGDQ